MPERPPITVEYDDDNESLIRHHVLTADYESQEEADRAAVEDFYENIHELGFEATTDPTTGVDGNTTYAEAVCRRVQETSPGGHGHGHDRDERG